MDDLKAQIEGLSEQQLNDILGKKFSFPIAREIVYELYNPRSQPRFLIRNGVLLFGNSQNLTPVTPEQIKQSIYQLTPYQLMSLYEYDKNVYFQVTDSLPKSIFLVNRSQKEYVKFYRQPRDLIPMVREKWPSTDIVQMIIRPYNYQNRKYKDRTNDMLEQNLFPYVVVTDESLIEDTTIENDDDTAERILAEKRVQDEIRTRLVKRYPNIDQIIEEMNKIKGDLLIDPNFILPTKYVAQKGLSYNSKYRLVWKTEYLPYPANPSNEQMTFYEIQADLVDYLKNFK